MFHIGMALLLMLLGYLVKYKRWSWLITGYNTSSRQEKASYDVEALCSSVGNFLFVLAGILLVTSLGEFLQAARIIASGWILFTAACIAFLIYANTGNRYKK